MNYRSAPQVLLYALPLTVGTIYLLKMVNFFPECYGAFISISNCMSQKYAHLALIILLLWAFLIYEFFEWLIKKQKDNKKGALEVLRDFFKKKK